MRKKRKLKISVKPAFAIVVEGQTEVWYFQMLKRNERSINVNIEPKIPQKKTLADQYETAIALSKDYDQVFWLVDLDIIIKESRETKKGKLKPVDELRNFKNKLTKFSNIHLVINNPCLEFWFLIHFAKTTKLFSECKSVEKVLKKHIAEYEKTQKYFTKDNNDIYIRLKPHLNFAIQVSEKFDPLNLRNPNRGISEMYKFFNNDKLKKIIDNK